MVPITQKIFASRRPGAKHGRLPKPQAALPTPISAGSTPGPKRLKLTFKRGQTGQPDERDADVYQYPFSARPSEPASAQSNGYNATGLIEDSLGAERGARQRKPPQWDVVVLGSEMENWITSSATLTKLENDEEEENMNSSPHKYKSSPEGLQSINRKPRLKPCNPAQVFTLRTPTRNDSPMTIQDCSPAPHNPVSDDVYEILSHLRSTPEIQVDLPNMWLDEAAGVPKPYSAAFLTALYIQCYENSLWHICDMVADTWIRALQDANARSQRSDDKRCHVWRKNVALEARFKQGKLGFKRETQELKLEIEDPDMAPDVAKVVPEHIRDLFAHTRPGCGATLLWADAVALAGRKMETEVVKRPDVWPSEFLFDVMCSALRMVGRKLTLKIEEKYEGAWCSRYHEHGKHGLPCYRQLAASQNSTKRGDSERVDTGKGRAGGTQFGDEQVTKQVRFGATAQPIIDIGDIDAEGESEES